MLAKIIAHGATRAAAFERLTAALDDTVVLGLTTNLRFLRWLVRQPAVLDGEARIDTLDRIWPGDDADARNRIPDDAWANAAAALMGVARADDPWRGGWRLNAPPTIRLEAEGEQRTVAAPASAATSRATVLVDGVAHVDVDGRSVAFRLAAPPDVDRAARAAARHAGGPVELTAPMPGSVIAVHAVPGDAVLAGDPLVTLEAMKMEHAVHAPFDGRVTELPVTVGEQVVRGQPLAVVEP
jgi:acetyl-CoA/propionyl-CoA carboxylase biotin carboxyl carrier protein